MSIIKTSDTDNSKSTKAGAFAQSDSANNSVAAATSEQYRREMSKKLDRALTRKQRLGAFAAGLALMAACVAGIGSALAAAPGNKNPETRAQICDGANPVFRDYATSGTNDFLTGKTINGVTISGYDADGYSNETIPYKDVLGDGSVYRGGNSRSGIGNGANDWIDEDVSDFASVLPYGNVYIDESKVKDWTHAVFEKNDDNSPFAVLTTGSREVDVHGNEVAGSSRTYSNIVYLGGVAQVAYLGGVTSYIQGVGAATYQPPSAGQTQSPSDRTVNQGGTQYICRALDGGTASFAKLSQGDAANGSSMAPHNTNAGRVVGSTLISYQNGTNTISPVNGTNFLYRIKYPEAAMLPSGEMGDLYLSVTKIEIESTIDIAEATAFGLQGPNNFGLRLGTTLGGVRMIPDYVEAYKNSDTYTAVGIGGAIDWTIEVRDSTGNLVDGTISYAARDLDLPSTQALWGRSFGDNFAEGLKINAGAKSYAVTPFYEFASSALAPSHRDDGWLWEVHGKPDGQSPLSVEGRGENGTANGLFFHTATKYNNRKADGTFIQSSGAIGNAGRYIKQESDTDKTSSGDNYDFYKRNWVWNRNDNGENSIPAYDTGFAVLLSSSGSKLTWSGSVGSSHTSVNTVIFDSKSFAQVLLSHGTGGGIYIEEYSSVDNGAGGTNCVTRLNENNNTVATNSTQVVTVTPEDGYRVKTITIDGTVYTLPTSWNADHKGKLIDANNAESNYTVEQNYTNGSPDGTYDITLVKVSGQRKVHVDFSADLYFSKEWRGETPTSINVSLTPYVLEGSVTIDGISYKRRGNTFTGNGKSWLLRENKLSVDYSTSGGPHKVYTIAGNNVIYDNDIIATITNTFVDASADASSGLQKQNYTLDPASMPSNVTLTERDNGKYDSEKIITWDFKVTGLAEELVPQSHDSINHIDRVYWFATEQGAPAGDWLFYQYDNSKAKIAGVIDKAKSIEPNSASTLWGKDSTGNREEAERIIQSKTDGVYLSVFEDTNNRAQGGKIVNITPAEIRATKIWKDYPGINSREDAVLHLDASYNENGVTKTIKDIRPAQVIKKDATASFSTSDKNNLNDMTAVWGTAKYLQAGADGIYYSPDDPAPLASLPALAAGESYTLEMKDTGLFYTAPSGAVYLYDVLVPTTADGNTIVYSVREDPIEGYETSIVQTTEGWEKETTGDKRQFRHFDVTNTYVLGTVSLKATKYIDGRQYIDADKFSFVLTAENKTPMPVSLSTRTLFSAPVVVENAVTTSDVGNARAIADFGVIAYHIDDLSERELSYGNATAAERASVATWVFKQGQYETVYTVRIPDEAVSTKTVNGEHIQIRYADATASEKQSLTWKSDDNVKTYQLLSNSTPNAAAVGTVLEGRFTYLLTENPADTAGQGDTQAVTNDSHMPNIVVYVLYNQIEHKMYVSSTRSGGSATNFVTGADATLPTNFNQTTLPGMVDLQPVYFTNSYASSGSWTPTAVKTLEGRPLERDQFSYKLKAVEEASNWVTKTPMPANMAASADTADSIRQDVELAGSTAAIKGTNNLYGPISFDAISYSHEDFAREITYGSASAEQAAKVTSWSWTSGDTSYVYGAIPDDATAAIGSITIDGNPTTKVMSYAEATDAERAAANSTNAASVWKKDGKIYIGATETNASVIDASAKGIFYDSTRSFTYKMWEVKGAADKGVTTYDSHISEATAHEIVVTITEQTDGTIKVEPKIRLNAAETLITEQAPVRFSNSYEAEGILRLKGTKTMDGRDEFGRETFTGLSEFEFTLSAVTENTPLPTGTGATTVKIKPAEGTKTADFQFADIKFTHAHLMDGTNYIAERNKDGLYERTFIYRITESSVSGGGMSMDTDPDENGDGDNLDDYRNSLLVAVTVQEDALGAMKVVAVNSADPLILQRDYYKKQNITLAITQEPGAAGKATTVSTVGGGTIYNTYQATGTVNLVLKKRLTGRKTLVANMFYFELKDAKGTVVAIKPNAADGSITWPIVYNLAQVRKDAEAGICEGPTTEDETAAKVWVYTYKATEIIPDDAAKIAGVTYDTSTKTIKVTVSDNGNGTLSATIAPISSSDNASPADTFTNTSELIDITVTKKWDDAAIKDEPGYDRPRSVSVQLNSNGTALGGHIALDATNNWTYTWTELPQYDAAGAKISYSVQEVDVPYGYTASVSPASIDSSTVALNEPAKVTITNTPSVKVLPADLVVRKIDSITEAPLAGVVFTLTNSQGAKVAEKTTSASGLASFTFDADGTYTLTETPKAGYQTPDPASYTIKVEREHIELEREGRTIFEWFGDFLFNGGAPAGYDEKAKTLTIKNTPKTYKVRIVKSFAGLAEDVDPAELFSNYQIDVSYKNSTGADTSKTLKLSDTSGLTVSGKTYTWTVDGVLFNSKLTTLESGYDVSKKGYDLVSTALSVSGDASAKTAPVTNPVQAALTVPALIGSDESVPAATVSYTNTYKRQLGKLQLTKIWNDDNNRDGKRPQNVSVTVTASAPVSGWTQAGEGSSKNFTLAGATWSTTFEDLPIFDAKGTEINYSISEPNVPTDYSAQSSAAVTLCQKASDVAQLSVTNSYTPKKGTITVTKVWDDENNKDKMRASTKLHLLANGSYVGGLTPQTVTTADSQTITWPNLYMYEAGEKITYTLREEAVNGYVTSYNPVEVKIADNGTASIEITNKHEVDTRPLKITKEWDDKNNQDGIRPESVTATIKAEFADGSAAPVFANGTSTFDVTLNATNSWTWEANPDLFQMQTTYEGKGVFYTVSEQPPTGYTAVVERTSAVAGSYKITNTHIPDTVEATITKAWNDDSNANYGRPLTVSFELWEQVGTAAASKTDKTLTLSADDAASSQDSWTNKISGLPAKRNGQTITYSWHEQVPTGYTASNNGVAANGGTVTNTPTKVDVSATKVWADEPDTLGTSLRKQVLLHLYGTLDGKVVYDAGEKTIAQDATGDALTVSWANQPEYFRGQKLVWKLEEAAIPGYTTTMSKNSAGTAFTVTNSYVGPVTKISVSKLWDDDNNRDGYRPAKVTFTLKPSIAGVVQGNLSKEVNVAADGTAEASWDKLPVVDKDGNAVLYTVTEVQVDKYEAPVIVATETPGVFVAVNRHVPETVDITATKLWANDVERYRPDHVSFQLYANDVAQDNTAILAEDAGGTWTHTFKGLYKKDQGTDITYSVREVTVPTGYEASYSQDKLTVTNTGKMGSLTVTKTWDDEDDNDGLRATALAAYRSQLKVLANGRDVTSQLTAGQFTTDSAAGTTTITYTNVPIYNNGKAILYTVEEGSIPEYSMSVAPVSTELSEKTSGGSSSWSGSISLTNKHVPGTKSVSITKVWKDNNNEDGLRPSLHEFLNTLTLLANGTAKTNVKPSVTTSDTNTYVVTWSNLLAKASDGSTITYQVRESLPSGSNYANNAAPALDYTVAEGGTITNINIAKTSLSGTKVWVDNNNAYNTRPTAGVPTLKLYRTSGTVPADPTEGTAVEVDGSNIKLDWNSDKSVFTYSGLPMFDNDGKRYSYWVVEDALDSSTYEAAVYSNPGNNAKTDRVESGGTVTNTLKQEKISIEGTKTWNHGSNPVANRPATVTLHLQANGEDVPNKSVTLDGTADSNGELSPQGNIWRYQFTQLDKYDADRELINYSVREDPVSSYSTSYDATYRNVINTYHTNSLGDFIRVKKTVNVTGQTTWTWPDNAKFVFRLFAVSAPEGVMAPMPSESIYGSEIYKSIEATKSDKTPSFGEISFEKPGTYVYRVRELTPAESNTKRLPGMSYDTEAYTITVVVGADMNIRVTVTNKAGETIRCNQGGDTLTTLGDYYELPFTNTFDESKVNYSLPAEKSYVDLSQLDENGRPVSAIASVNGKFNFTMRPTGTNAATAPMPSDYYDPSTGSGLQGAGAERVYYARNASNEISFEADGEHAIRFDEEHAGKSYGYDIAELIPDTARYLGHGFWYDELEQMVYDGVTHTFSLNVKMENDVLTVIPAQTHLDSFLDPEPGTTYADAKGGELTGRLTEQEKQARHSGTAPKFLNSKTPVIDVSATKVWDDANNQDGRRPNNVWFYIEREDGEPVVDIYGKQVETKAGIAGTNANLSLTATWSNLPRYKLMDDGSYSKISYTVYESADGQPARNSVPGYADQVITGNDEDGFTITNKRLPTLYGVSVTKKWEDGGNVDSKRPDTIRFHLDQNKSGEATPTVSDFRVPITTNEASGWKASWLNLPARYGDATKDFVYSLREDPIEGYTAEGFVEGAASLQVQLPAEAPRPLTPSVHVTLMEDGTAKGASIELNAANNWTATFTDSLDSSAFSTDGYYDILVSGTASGLEKHDLQKTFIRNYTITNSYELKDIKATKVWVDGNNAENTRKDVTFKLKAVAGGEDVTNNVMNSASEVADKTIPATALGDDLTVSWKGMPTQIKRDDVLKPIVYELSEVPVAGYNTTIEGNAQSGFIVSNKLSGTTSISGTKVWQDGGQSHDNQYEITLQLWQRSSRGGTTPQLLAKIPEWEGDEWSFTDLPTHDSEGYRLSYYVIERNVNGYNTSYTNTDPTVSGLALNGCVITNKLASNLIDFQALKVWDDEGNEDGLRKDVTLHLYRKVGDKPEERMAQNYDRTITLGGTGIARWTNMPVTVGNDKIVYRVQEEPLTGYEASYSGNQSEGFIVTNTHKRNTVSVVADKIWDDQDNAAQIRPSSVTFHLIASVKEENGTISWTRDMGSAKASEPSWRATWSNMPHKLDGKLISYTVVEEDVLGYVMSNLSDPEETGELDKGTLTYGFKLTNKPMNPVTEVRATKIWMDNNNQDGKRDEVQLRLEMRVGAGAWVPATIDCMEGAGHQELEYKTIDPKDDSAEVKWENLKSKVYLDESGKVISAAAVGGWEDDSQDASNRAMTAAQEGAAAAEDAAQNEASNAANETDAAPATKAQQAEAPDAAVADAQSGAEAQEDAPAREEGATQPAALNPLASLFRLRPAYADDPKPASEADVYYRVVEYYKKYTNEEKTEFEWTKGAPEGYTSFVTQPEPGVFEVYNVHTPETRDFTVRKVWNDNGTAKAPDPVDIEVQLVADGADTGPAVTIKPDNLSYTWEALPVYREGEKINYTARETTVPENYSVAYMADGAGYVIVNSYQGTLRLAASKIWQDQDGKVIKPGSGVKTPQVTITLYKNGTKLDSKTIASLDTLSSSAKLEVSWDNLPRLEGGKRVAYHVEETVESSPASIKVGESSKSFDEAETVTFTNQLSPVAPGPTDPDKIIKVTYIDNLVAEDGNGGNLKSNAGELVYVFKTRAGDLDTTKLTTVGAVVSKNAIVDPADEDALAERSRALRSQASGDQFSEAKVPDHKDSDGHSRYGWVFTGWTYNIDAFGDYVMVAHHRRAPAELYVNGQDGKISSSRPGDNPTADGLIFVGWEKITDSFGNVIYIAKWKCAGTSDPGGIESRQTPGGVPLLDSRSAGSGVLPKTDDSTNFAGVAFLGGAGLALLLAGLAESLRERRIA